MSKPRVLTIDELLALPHWAVVWEERKEGETVERYVRPMICTRDHTLLDEDGEVVIHKDMLGPWDYVSPSCGRSQGRRRFWDKKPTMQQRREAEWE